MIDQAEFDANPEVIRLRAMGLKVIQNPSTVGAALAALEAGDSKTANALMGVDEHAARPTRAELNVTIAGNGAIMDGLVDFGDAQ